MKLHFPHISRIFSARVFSRIGTLVLWILLVALISFNIFLWNTKPLAYSDNIIDVLTHPFSAPVHENLAQALQKSGVHTLADRELAIAAELNPVLGADTTAKAQRKEAEMISWHHILAGRPDYRDAYVQLAALTYEAGNLTQAHAYLLKAQLLDPNNATVNRLADFTSKLLE
jgi:tetratricopeptide (TPR) repeat protein